MVQCQTGLWFHHKVGIKHSGGDTNGNKGVWCPHKSFKSKDLEIGTPMRSVTLQFTQGVYRSTLIPCTLEQRSVQPRVYLVGSSKYKLAGRVA